MNMSGGGRGSGKMRGPPHTHHLSHHPTHSGESVADRGNGGLGSPGMAASESHDWGHLMSNIGIDEAELDDANLFVGDLSRDVTEEDLSALFSIHGRVLHVEIKCDKESEASLGYGFVQMKSREEAELARQRLQRRTLKGRPIRIGWAQKNTSLFVGDLDPSVTTEALRAFFATYGELVEEETFVKDRNYGFVRYLHRAHAERAKRELNGQMLGGRPIRIGWGNTHPRRSCVYFKFNARGEQGQAKINDQSLLSFFSQYGKVLGINLPTSNSKLKGYGFVHFPNNSEGETAAHRVISEFPEVSIDNVTFSLNFGHKKAARETAGPSQQPSSSSTPASSGLSESAHPTFSSSEKWPARAKSEERTNAQFRPANQPLSFDGAAMFATQREPFHRPEMESREKYPMGQFALVPTSRGWQPIHLPAQQFYAATSVEGDDFLPVLPPAQNFVNRSQPVPIAATPSSAASSNHSSSGALASSSPHPNVFYVPPSPSSPSYDQLLPTPDSAPPVPHLDTAKPFESYGSSQGWSGWNALKSSREEFVPSHQMHRDARATNASGSFHLFDHGGLSGVSRSLGAAAAAAGHAGSPSAPASGSVRSSAGAAAAVPGIADASNMKRTPDHQRSGPSGGAFGGAPPSSIVVDPFLSPPGSASPPGMPSPLASPGSSPPMPGSLALGMNSLRFGSILPNASELAASLHQRLGFDER